MSRLGPRPLVSSAIRVVRSPIAQVEQSISDLCRIATRPDRDGHVRSIVADDRQDIGALGCQARCADGRAPDLDLLSWRVDVAFDEDQIALGVQRFQLIIDRPDWARQKHADGVLRDDGGWITTRLAMAVGVLAGRVQFVCVAGVFDRTNAKATRAKFAQEFDHERSLAVVLASDNVDPIHSAETPSAQDSHSNASDSPG